ncbi:MAG: FeoB small GTPase domain-containing protein [Bacillota bacterium]
MNIALAGNPNSGKTTIFNMLTGKCERVGNWAGVTVSSRHARLRKRFNTTHHDITIVDLPGTYSLDAYTKDEQHAIDFIYDQAIDVIINVVDASNLERNLYLTTELQALNIPMIVILNKSDIVERRKTLVDINQLKTILNTDVFFLTATKRRGIKNVIAAAIDKGDSQNYEARQKRRQSRRRERQKTISKRHC